MHAAFIIDDERLRQEQAMLNRLCIGLMAEGVNVTRVVPDTAMPDAVSQSEQRIALAPRIETTMRVLPWMRWQRTARVLEQLEKKKPDVFYAVGRQAWSLSLELAQEMERPVLIDVALPGQAKLAPQPQQSRAIAGYVVCTPWLAEALGRRVESSMISVVPIGVALPPQPREVSITSDRPVSIAILGRGDDEKSYAAALEAIGRIWRRDRSLQVFLELRSNHDHDLWRLANKLDLLSIVSVIGDAALHRTLVVECDVLLLPEPAGEPRSVILEAMANGIPVIARRDDAIASLVNEFSADVYDEPDVAVISERLSQVIESSKKARAIGQRGRAWIEAHHRSSHQVQEMMRTLEQALSGGAVKLAGQLP